MKKRIVILTGLLVLCILGQGLLRSSLDSDTIGLLTDQEETQLTDTGNLFKSTPKNSDNLQGQLIKQLFMMIGIVGLIGVGVWIFCKKLACNWTTGKSKNINVLETVSLGPRKLLHIVRVGSKQYLISSTPENINMLSEITESLGQDAE